MASISDIGKNSLIDIDGTPCRIVEYQHAKLGRGGAMARTKVKNLKTGAVLDITFKGSDNIDLARVDHRKVQFLYRDEDGGNFMDTSSYEQFNIPHDILGDSLDYLSEGAEVNAQFYNGACIGLDLPANLYLEVTYTEPGIKGDSVSNTLKDATLETGAKIRVPLFINIGDILKVDTRSGKYLERKR